MVVYILVIMVLFAVLYYLYNWLYGASDVQDIVVWSDPTVGLPTGKTTGGSTTGPDVPANQAYTVPYIYSGGEYTVSTWIYVTKWDNTGNKPFLTLSGGGGKYNTLLLFLGKNKNKLGVRVSYTADTSINPCAGLLTLPTSGISGCSGPSEYTSMLGYATSGGGYQDGVMPQADIEDINLQRWVCITVVLMGKTVDVYVDGKLSRSSILPGFFKSDGETVTDTSAPQKITLGDKNSFSGYIGITRAANMAYTPDRVYANYQRGPFSAWSLSSLDPSQYSLTLKRNSSTIFSI